MHFVHKINNLSVRFILQEFLNDISHTFFQYFENPLKNPTSQKPT